MPRSIASSAGSSLMSARDRIKVARLGVIHDQAKRVKELASAIVGKAIMIAHVSQEGIHHFSHQEDDDHPRRHPAPSGDPLSRRDKRDEEKRAEDEEKGWAELHEATMRVKELLEQLQPEVASLTRS